MPFNWRELIKLLPILSSIAAPGVGQLAGQLIAIGTAELDRRVNASGKTREAVLEEAAIQWQKNIDNASALKDLGHT